MLHDSKRESLIKYICAQRNRKRQSQVPGNVRSVYWENNRVDYRHILSIFQLHPMLLKRKIEDFRPPMRMMIGYDI